MALLLLAGVRQSCAWCGRNDEGDCFIAIRTGGEPETAREHARGIKFVHEDTGVAGLEETFGYIAGVPNLGQDSSELRFVLGEVAQARLMGSGVFHVKGIDVGGDASTDMQNDPDHIALKVTRGGLQITNEKYPSVIKLQGPGLTSANVSLSQDQTAVETSGRLELRAGKDSVVDVQGAIFQDQGEVEKTMITIGSLLATSGKAVVGDSSTAAEASSVELQNRNGQKWTLQNHIKRGFEVLHEDQRIVGIAHSAPRDSLTVSEEGNMGIGTRWPSVKLDVNGGVQGTSAYSSASDRRWKRDIKTLSRLTSLKKVLNLRPVSFEFQHEAFPEKAFDQGLQIGFIAQEVEDIVPEVVRTGADGMKSVQYASLVPLLVNAIQELEAKLALYEEKLQRSLIADVHLK